MAFTKPLVIALLSISLVAANAQYIASASAGEVEPSTKSSAIGAFKLSRRPGTNTYDWSATYQSFRVGTNEAQDIYGLDVPPGSQTPLGQHRTILQYHIHIGPRKVNIPNNQIVFLRGRPGALVNDQAPGPAPFTVSGTFTTPGDLANGFTQAQFEQALESEGLYHDIHTSTYPAAEIRGQIVRG